MPKFKKTLYPNFVNARHVLFFLYCLITTAVFAQAPNISYSTPQTFVRNIAKTGIISGTTTVLSASDNYTITAYNGAGSSSTIINMQVLAAAPLIAAPNISYATPQTYMVNSTITPLQPTNNGGAVPATIFGDVTTLAGSGAFGSTNGQGTAASFSTLYSITTDAAGDMYVADYNNNLIRKITKTGAVTTFAGSGGQGANNGNSTTATFNHPGGVAIDDQSNVYVGDQDNNLIRKITPTGIVSTFAGSGTLGLQNGSIATAQFSGPAGLVFDSSENLYVADRNNNVIRKITPLGIVSTFAGSGAIGSADGDGNLASFNNPTNVAVDNADNIYVTDQNNNKIRKITPAGVVTTLAGSGTQGRSDGVIGTFNKPFGLVVDPVGMVYVADEFNHLIRRISPAGYVSVIAGSGTIGSTNGIATAASFNYPADLTLDGLGNLYVADAVGHTIRKVVVSGYAIDSNLPAGLSFDVRTGIITGTPTAVSPAKTYNITAYNGGGYSTTAVSIQVLAPVLLPSIITLPPIATPNTIGIGDDYDPKATSTNTQTPIVYTSSNTSVATIVNGVVHIVGVGQTIITATQIGNSNYLPATPVSVTLTVMEEQYITFPTITSKLICDVDFAAGTTSNFNVIPITYTSSDQTVATINSLGIIHIIGAGTTTITANQAGNNLYVAAPPVSQQLTVTAPPGPAPSVSITADVNNVYGGVPITFTATPANAGTVTTYQWQVNGLNVGTNNATYISSILKTGDAVTCIIVSSIACSTPATSNAIYITLLPAPTITVTNTFTPNGDGINDVWNIPDLANYPGCLMSVYTRYGTLVFQSRGYAKAWDGTNSGQQLPFATYYYVLSLDDKSSTQKMSGPISIVR
jgi:gliding motility-associated-like protein